MNGTGARSLTEDYLTAANAVTDAMAAVQRSCPNGRDYYVQEGDAFDIASREHWNRLERLAAVRDELNAIAEHCSNFIKP